MAVRMKHRDLRTEYGELPSAAESQPPTVNRCHRDLFADLDRLRNRSSPLAIFGMFAAVAWWVLEHVAAGKPRAIERLDELKNPRKRNSAESALKKSDAVTKMLERATPALAKPLQPKNELEIGKLKSKLSYAGFRGESAGSIFLGLKFAGLIAGLFLGGGSIVAIKGMNQKSADVDRWAWPACCSICPISSSGSWEKIANRPFFSPCPTPWI